MGVIERQGIKQAIVTYIGIAIGAINMLYIYPNYLTEEELGVIKFIDSVAVLILPFVMFGSASLVVRFFPNFKDEKANHHGWLGFNLLLIAFGFCLFLLSAFIFQDGIYAYYADKPKLYLDYLPYVIPFVLFTSILNLLERYSSNFHRIVVPPIFSNLLIKFVIPVVVILYAFDFFEFNVVFKAKTWVYAIAVLATFAYIAFLRQFHLKINWKAYTTKLKSDMFTFASYGLFGNLSQKLATQIDIIMLANMTDLKKVATYSIAYVISDVIDVPRRALEGISNPILAEAFKKDDKAKILDLYKKTALTQLTFGCLIFIGIWASIDDLFALIPRGERFIEGKYVVLILGLGTLFDQATGLNTYIIGYSRFFRFNFWLIVAMSVVNIGNNVFLIPVFSVLGAALATMMSKFIYNFAKTYFVWKKMKIHPFSKQYIKLIFLAIFAYFIGSFVPSFPHNIFSLIAGLVLRSIIIASVFISGLLYFNISEEVNDLIEKAFNWIGISIKRSNK